jgi:hypothetical protein
MMVDKAGARAWLLQLYESTGDEDYRRAADCLKPRTPRGRPKDAAPAALKAPPRIERMNEMLLRDKAASVHDAARREVRLFGRGAHATEEAAVVYLSKLYRASEEATYAWLKRSILDHNAWVRLKSVIEGHGLVG